MGNSKETKVVDHDYSLMPVPKFARRRFLTMFMIMLGFTFFSASMWTGQQLGDSMDLPGFIGALALGGAILAVYTGALAYVGAKTGLSLDLLAQHSFGAKGSYLPSVLISFTQIGWFGVGVAMFAIPVAKLIDPENQWLPYVLVLIAGACMMGSAFFGIKAMTVVSYISVPLIAILGITAMVMAVQTGDVPLAEKFAENFSHRDFMGAILNLGIERSTVGDIWVEGKSAYVFCTDAIAPFLQENMVQVRHTKVRCIRLETAEGLPERKFAYREENVASLRSDGIVGAVWKLSRSQSQTLFSQKKVFVNGLLTENGSRQLKDGDTVSVRGFGKFIFRGEKHTTRKGKLVVGVDVFV